MSDTALTKLLKSFKTAQHDYKINTDHFGSLDATKVAKELDLEKIGAEKEIGRASCRERLFSSV